MEILSMERNFEMVQLNEESLVSLTQVVSVNSKHADYLNRALVACNAYVDAVNRSILAIRSAYLHLDGEALREAVSNADSDRNSAHNNAIANVRLIENMASKYGISPVFLGDINDRLQVADFCLDVSNHLFQNRTR